MDEEDDECHLGTDKREIGSSRSSPDSRWRRCISVSASRKSDRSFIGAFLPDLFSVMNESSDICRTLQAMDNRSGLHVPICPSQCTFLQSSQFLRCQSRYVESFRKRS